MKNKKYYIMVGIVIVVIGGMLFAASKATPISFLYPVKLQVIEKVHGLTKNGDLNKANYAQSLAKQRLQELTTLKSENLLETNGNSARDNFNYQTIVIQNSILNLSNSNGVNSKEVLQLSENLNVMIEEAKAIFNIDQLEVLPEDAPIPKATSTKATSTKTK